MRAGHGARREQRKRRGARRPVHDGAYAAAVERDCKVLRGGEREAVRHDGALAPFAQHSCIKLLVERRLVRPAAIAPREAVRPTAARVNALVADQRRELAQRAALKMEASRQREHAARARARRLVRSGGSGAYATPRRGTTAGAARPRFASESRYAQQVSREIARQARRAEREAAEDGAA